MSKQLTSDTRTTRNNYPELILVHDTHTEIGSEEDPTTACPSAKRRQNSSPRSTPKAASEEASEEWSNDSLAIISTQVTPNSPYTNSMSSIYVLTSPVLKQIPEPRKSLRIEAVSGADDVEFEY